MNKADQALAEQGCWIRWALKPLKWLLQRGDPTATIDRLFASKHLRDLQFIVAAAVLVVLAVVVAAVVQALLGARAWIDKHDASQDLLEWLFPQLFARYSFLSLTTLYYVLRNIGRDVLHLAAVFAAFGAVLAWAYRAGSARLGVVDLFACEIGTLCRAAAVVEAVRRCVERFKEGPAEARSTGGSQPPPRPFASAEDYFPVFQSNSRDLEALDERTVMHITEFYTYMKAMRDMQRALSQTRPGPADFNRLPPFVGPWRGAARDVVYMLYLALESARHATDQLVEFEPERVERTIVILNSELEAYRFLCDQFPNRDAHRERLRFREREYRQLVWRLLNSVRKKPGLKEIADKEARALAENLWGQARLLLPKLRDRRRLALRGAVGTTAEEASRPPDSSAPDVNSSGGGRDVRAAWQPSACAHAEA